MADLVDPANRSRYVHPFGFTGPAFQVGGVYIWGFTALLLDGLLELAGWSLPWDGSRETAVPDRLLRDRP
ncbi:MAG: hypothetical protein IPL43_13370 [Micropruina sp.]|nr:hypothetical protein [Micropruina sp.]